MINPAVTVAGKEQHKNNPMPFNHSLKSLGAAGLTFFLSCAGE